MSENNDLDDRLSRRFDDDSPEDTDNSESESESDRASSKSQSSRNSQKSQKPQNVKKEWNVRSIYLDDTLESELTTMFKRLDLELSEADTDVELQKTRHFYPLIIELGLERLEEMDVTEIIDQLESMDR
jgi:hypothetical protein